MENCKDKVEVTMRAAVLDVTPEETAAKAKEAAEAEGGGANTEAAVAAAPEEPTVDPELVAAGGKVFRKCKACHQIGEGAKNRSGPILTDVVGKPAGAVEGFKYSKALQAAAEAGLVWDHAALGAFLAKPKGFLKGTKMSFPGLRKEADIEALIAYLQNPEG